MRNLENGESWKVRVQGLKFKTPSCARATAGKARSRTGISVIERKQNTYLFFRRDRLRKGRDWIILWVMIQYGLAEDVDLRVKEIIQKLKMSHIDETRVICLRSKGSVSKRVIARCHGLPRIMQVALDKKPHYIIEILSESFDQLSREEQTKVLIHEILHIPYCFGGGFRAHKPYVTTAKVRKMFEKFVKVNIES